MKKLLLFILCALFFSPAMAQQKKKKKRPAQRTAYARRTDLMIVHDTMSAPITLADSIAYEASKHLGKPYRLGTKGPNVFDCSGFTSYVFKQLGFSLGSNSRDQYRQGIKVSREHIHKGDMVFFSGRDPRGGVGHVGIVFDVDRKNRTFSFIHAATSKGITLQRFPDSGYYTKRLIGFRRMVDVTSPAPLPVDNTFYSLVPPPVAIEPDGSAADKLQETIDEKNTTLHIVKRGENINAIARKYGYTATQVRKWNKLEPGERLREGQNLIIRLDEQKPSEAVLASLEKAEKEKLGALTNHRIVVQEGETIYSISEKFNCTVKEIANWNRLKTINLHPGQELTIRPIAAEAPKDTIMNGELVHTVLKGENIYQIARNYGCQPNELKAWNNLKDNVVKSGMRLTIMRADKKGVHTVRAGETFESICLKYNCTPDQLKEWNNLTGTSMRPGRILKVSEDAKSIYDKDSFRITSPRDAMPIAMLEDGSAEYISEYYTVKSGDNYGKIAQKHKVSTARLMEWNKTPANKLRPGMRIVVKKVRVNKPKPVAKPDSAATPVPATPVAAKADTAQASTATAAAEPAATVPAPAATTTPLPATEPARAEDLAAAENDGNIYYTVKSGDTFKKIALKYNTTTGRLLEWNNLTTYKLVPGKKMIVGKARGASSQQKTAEKQKNTAPAAKKQQATTPPSPNAEGNIVYTVKEGDNLYNIARRHNCTVAQLKEWNNLKTDRLKLKQKLIIKQQTSRL